MDFGWDLRKAAANLKNHRVSFDEAATVFRDDHSVTGQDPDHSISEYRFVTFGLSAADRVLVVSHTERGNVIWIISARRATRHERKIYEEG